MRYAFVRKNSTRRLCGLQSQLVAVTSKAEKVGTVLSHVTETLNM